MNSAAPDSTTAALAADAPLEKKDEKSDKGEQPVGVPGAFPETPGAEIGINPMPAAPGALNPINLAPGEKIPENITAQGTTSEVKLDPESYEKSDTLPSRKSPLIISLLLCMLTSARWWRRYSFICRASLH
jgi:hypothetical protein